MIGTRPFRRQEQKHQIDRLALDQLQGLFAAAGMQDGPLWMGLCDQPLQDKPGHAAVVNNQ